MTHKVTPPDPPEKRRRSRRPHIPLAWKRDEHIRTTRKRRREERRTVRAAKKAEKKTARTEKKVNSRLVIGRRDLPWILRAPRMMFLVLSGVMVFVITIVGMVESWRNLYEWGLAHHWGGYAVGVPVLVDFFILTSEMLLFVLIVDGRYGLFSWFTKAYLWFMFLFGLGLSLAGNVDHLRHVDIPSRVGFALPPLASAMGMASILMVLKMIAEDYEQQPAPAAPAPAPAAPVAPPEPVLPELWTTTEALARSGTSILVPSVEHQDKVAHPMAHDGAPAADGPNMDHRPVNGATRPVSSGLRAPRVQATPAMVHAAREHLARLRRDGEPFPTDRKLAGSHFNPSGEKGKGNRRAAQRVLAEFKEAT